MEAIKAEETFRAKLDNYDCTLCLVAEHLQLSMINDTTFTKYTAEIDQHFLKTNRNLQFFFTTIAELYHYLTSCFSELTITKHGTLLFSLEMNLGAKVRKYECEIQTKKEEMPQVQAYLIKANKMQNQIDALKQQTSKLRKAFEEHVQEQKAMVLKIAQYEKMINGKDQIINTIFHELKQFREWREQHQKREECVMSEKNKFIMDDVNPHFKKFVQIGNKFKKVTGGSWDVLINKIPIDKNQATKYHIRQIKAGNNGSFMYGIGTQFIKGLNRAQDSKQFIGYYENTGNVYEQGQSKKGGPKIKDGQLITMIADPKKWKIYWYINGKKQAEANIGVQLRTKNLYLALIVFNDESQIQFLN